MHWLLNTDTKPCVEKSCSKPWFTVQYLLFLDGEELTENGFGNPKVGGSVVAPCAMQDCCKLHLPPQISEFGLKNRVCIMTSSLSKSVRSERKENVRVKYWHGNQKLIVQYINPYVIANL